jgi:hypothetical protein
MGIQIIPDYDTQRGNGYYAIDDMPKKCLHCPDSEFFQTLWRCGKWHELWQAKEKCVTVNL